MQWRKRLIPQYLAMRLQEFLSSARYSLETNNIGGTYINESGWYVGINMFLCLLTGRVMD